MPSLHLGLTPWIISNEYTAQRLASQAERAQHWGYGSFWLPESHFAGTTSVPEPLMLLSAVAARTQTIKLATTSYLLPTRHPLQAAEQVAVLDQLSGGRVILGVGRGYLGSTFNAFGVESKHKRAIFRDSLNIMIKAWSGAPVSESSEQEPIVLSPLPVQQPHPPIWLAAFGPKALVQAGGLGLPYIASPLETLEQLIANYTAHGEACDAAGVERPSEVPIMRTMFVSDNRRLLEQIRGTLNEHTAPFRRTALGARTTGTLDDWALVGELSYVREQIQRYREALGVTHLIVTRLRINDIEPAALERSVAMLAEVALG